MTDNWISPGLAARTRNFLGEDGALSRFEQARTALENTAMRMFYAPDYCESLQRIDAGEDVPLLDPAYRATRSHRPGLDLEQADDLLFGGPGIRTTWINGVGTTVQYRLKEPPLDMPLAQRIREFVAAFSDPSELKVFRHNIGISNETVREGLTRVVNEIDAMGQANRDLYSADEWQSFEKCLLNYRVTLANMMDYVDTARKQLGEGKDTRKAGLE